MQSSGSPSTRTRGWAAISALLLVCMLATAVPADAEATVGGRDTTAASTRASWMQDNDVYDRRMTERTYDTPEGNFRLHYDESPQLVTRAELAFVVEMGDAFEEALAHMVDVQGWKPPAPDGVLGGDSRTDVYLVDMQTNGLGADGVAPTDEESGCDPARCTDVHGYLLMDNDYGDLDPAERTGTVRSTAVHELHHLVQAAEAQLNGTWMFEMTAMWQESVVFPEINRRLSQVEDAAAEPEAPLTRVGDGGPDDDGTDFAHAYGRWPFLTVLTDTYDADIVRDAWRLSLDRGQEGLGGFSAALERRGGTFAEEFASYATLTAAWPEVQLPVDVLDGDRVEWPEVARLDEADSLPYDRQLQLDHTAYSVIDVPTADAIGATIEVGAAAQVFVALVAVTGSSYLADIRPAVGGVATAFLDDVGDADRVSVVVVNADPTTIGPREDPFDNPQYRHDGVGIRLEVSDDIEPVVGQSVADAERVGAPDGVEQAIATSQAMFADGSADRVVLATADQFPDALAGAGLAGDRGPILLTPTAEVLDPRVSAEIRRVTDGDGIVLVLGGEAAVTATAAEQARLAAGDRGCSVPLPVSCRFAGNTREHTAALIAHSVIAEHGGQQVLIARADDFADALTGGAYAAAAGVPLLLTPSTAAGGPAQAFLEANPQLTDVVVLGGEAAVGTLAFEGLRATRRVAGAERTATTAAIAEQLWLASGRGEAAAVLVNVRAADGWPAALTAAVASALLDAPQLGVETPPAALSVPVLDYLRAAGPPLIAVFGDHPLVSDAQFQQALDTAG